MPLHKELRAKWEKAGYTTTMGSAAVVSPPPKEFLRVYHLTSAEFAINSIALQRIKVARLADLNDPFELLAVNFREQNTRKVTRDFKSEYDTHTGLLCFSADWKDPVLWSHYGTKHHGICLGFNLRRSIAQKVNYEDKRLLAKLGDNANPNSIPKELQKVLLHTKFKHWQYEQEVRVFVPLESAQQEGRLHFRPFDEELVLAEVILGPQCSLSLEAVRQLTKTAAPNALAYKSRLAYKFFSVVPQENSVP